MEQITDTAFTTRVNLQFVINRLAKINQKFASEIKNLNSSDILVDDFYQRQTVCRLKNRNGIIVYRRLLNQID